MSDVITVTGNIATPPELKHTPAGLPILTFRLASTERRYDRAQNVWVDGATNWYSVSAFRGLAEHAHRSLEKGNRVILTGRLHVRQWESGDRRGTAVDIDADAIGHDLRWGTTSYQADRSPAAREGDGDEGEAWAVRGQGADSDGDAAAAAPLGADGTWSVPGAGAGSEGMLVGASAETPF
jgi:single-strand DNA-binding protein